MKKLKPKHIIIIVIAVIVFSALMGILFGKDPDESPKNEPSITASSEIDTQTPEESSSEKDFSSDIIWKDEEQYGIVNLHIDGNHTKQVILNDYYLQMSSFLEDLDRSILKDYKYIEFVGNVVRDNKIECTIKGNIDISLIKNNAQLSAIDLQDNIQDLFIPKPLQ